MNAGTRRRELIATAWSVIDARSVLRQTRTDLMRCVRTVIPGYGDRVRGPGPEFLGSKLQAYVPPGTFQTLEPLLLSIRETEWKIRDCTNRLADLAERHFPETGLLVSVPYVDMEAALPYVCVIDNPLRFRNSRSVGPYLYLTSPRSFEAGKLLMRSGDETRREYVGQCLIDVAKLILSPRAPNTDLKRWGLRLGEGQDLMSFPRIGVVTAVARKLAVLLHHLWSTGEVYKSLLPPRESAAWA